MSAALIKALQSPGIFPHPVTRIQLIETHISWVILTGDIAYKIKKPMNFGFLDFTTLEARKKFCEQEVAYNAPMNDIYEKVIGIGGSEDAPVLGSSDNAFEYAIQMKQFDQSGLLSNLIDEGSLSYEHMISAAESLTEFHQQAEPLTSGELGAAQAVFEPARDNFTAVKSLLENQERDQDLVLYQQLEAWALEQETKLEELMAERKQQGFVRPCHGDLHLNNMGFENGKVFLFDCIEFNEGFRCIDVMNDVAFLLMDLEQRGRDDLSTIFLNHYLELTGDYAGVPLLNYYKSYRAMVRAKVHILTGLDPAKTEADKQTEFDQAHRYAKLAEEYAKPVSAKAFIMCGISGSGKSRLSLEMLKQQPAIRIRSDVERKRLFNENNEAGIDKGLYDPKLSEETYLYLGQLAAQLLSKGWTVILDAACLAKSERAWLIDALKPAQPTLVFCEVSAETAKQRVIDRSSDNRNVSDASPEVIDHQLKKLTLPTADEGASVITLDTNDASQLSQATKKVLSSS